jgi:hypothetical protein
MAIVNSSQESLRALREQVFNPGNWLSDYNILMNWLNASYTISFTPHAGYENWQSYLRYNHTPEAIEEVETLLGSPEILGWWTHRVTLPGTQHPQRVSFQYVLVRTKGNHAALLDTSGRQRYMLLVWTLTRTELLEGLRWSIVPPEMRKRFIPSIVAANWLPQPHRLGTGVRHVPREEANLDEMLAYIQNQAGEGLYNAEFYWSTFQTRNSLYSSQTRIYEHSHRAFVHPLIWNRAMNAIVIRHGGIQGVRYFPTTPETRVDVFRERRELANLYGADSNLLLEDGLTIAEAASWSVPSNPAHRIEQPHTEICAICGNTVPGHMVGYANIEMVGDAFCADNQMVCFSCRTRTWYDEPFHRASMGMLGDSRIRENQNRAVSWCSICESTLLYSSSGHAHLNHILIRITDEGEEAEEIACHMCRNDLYTCDGCRSYIHGRDCYESDGVYYCYLCRRESYDEDDDYPGERVSHATNPYDHRVNVIDEEFRNMYNRYTRPEVIEAPAAGLTVLEWCWSPQTLQFWPPKDPLQRPRLYIGMELEIAFPNTDCTVAGEVWIAAHMPADRFWAKHDGSVTNGVELVTHPFQPRWGLENITWEAFDDLVARAKAYPEHSSAGGHIHLSKDAFDTAAVWRLLQIHRKQPSFCGVIGGRGCTSSFGSFYGSQGAPTSLSPRQLKETAQAKEWILSSRREERGYGNRYVAVNLNPQETIELRYPQGTIVPARIRKNIEWTEALYELCTKTPVKFFMDCCKDIDVLTAWIQAHNDQWPNLVEWINKRWVPIREEMKNACA